MYTIEEKVIDVIIVPPEKIFFPGFEKVPTSLDNFIKPSPEKGLKKINGFSEEEKKFIGQSARKITSKDVKSKTDSIIFDSNLPSGFRLSLPLESKLDLSLKSGGKENMFDEIYKDKVKKNLNLSKYLYSDFSNIHPKRNISSFGGFGNRSAARRGKVTFNIKDYDLTPWATEVVNKIQKNWIIPSSQKTIKKGQVEISVIIEKNGELSSIEIVNPSKLPLLDQIALKALNLSAPFPKLPDDFPDKDLKAIFLFHYDGDG